MPSLKHQPHHRARPRAGSKNHARRLDPASQAPCVVSSRRNCSNGQYQSQIKLQNLNRHYDSNQQYSITAVSDGGGSVVERYAYSAYGHVTIADGSGSQISNSEISNRYTYTGRERDEGLSLYHYRARMYDAVCGRFVSRDPRTYWDGMLPYGAYFLPDGVDPSGQSKRRPPVGDPPVTDLPATPDKCSLVNRQLDLWAVSHNQTLLDHWRNGSGNTLRKPFWHFDSSFYARGATMDATVAKAKQGLACSQSVSVTHSQPEPTRSNQTNATVTPMIYGWRFWYECKATVSKTCHKRPCSDVPCFEFSVSVSCNFHAKDHVNFWNTNIPFCTPEYCFTDQLVRACNPNGRGFDVVANESASRNRKEGCSAHSAQTGGGVK